MVKRTMSISKGLRVRQAVATLFEGFKRSQRPETAWARRLMRADCPTDCEIEAEILGAIERYCPALPQEFVPFIIELLTAGIRLAQREDGLDLVIRAPRQEFELVAI